MSTSACSVSSRWNQSQSIRGFDRVGARLAFPAEVELVDLLCRACVLLPVLVEVEFALEQLKARHQGEIDVESEMLVLPCKLLERTVGGEVLLLSIWMVEVPHDADSDGSLRG